MEIHITETFLITVISLSVAMCCLFITLIQGAYRIWRELKKSKKDNERLRYINSVLSDKLRKYE